MEKIFKKMLSVKKITVINHFENNISDMVSNRIKLNLLERIMMANTSKVIILSTIHPLAFLEMLAEESLTEKTAILPDIERWHVLFGHFRIINFALQSIKPAKADRHYQTIIMETAYTHFLNRMCTSAIKVAANFPNKKAVVEDEMILKFQITFHYFYMYIWQSLNKKEKFLLYDLPEDNLVNSFDDYNLNTLFAKGVIIKVDGSLKLFNKGFRNFILTAIGNAEAAKIQNLIKDKGNRNKFKNPLKIIIVAILIFLLVSQEEAYSKIITYVATLGAGIPAIIKLFSLFDKTNQK